MVYHGDLADFTSIWLDENQLWMGFGVIFEGGSDWPPGCCYVGMLLQCGPS